MQSHIHINQLVISKQESEMIVIKYITKLIHNYKNG